MIAPTIGYKRLFRTLLYGNRELGLRRSKKLGYLAFYEFYNNAPLGDLLWEARNELKRELSWRTRGHAKHNVPLILRIFDRLCEESNGICTKYVQVRPLSAQFGIESELAEELHVSRERIRQIHNKIAQTFRSTARLRVQLQKRLLEQRVVRGDLEAHELY